MKNLISLRFVILGVTIGLLLMVGLGLYFLFDRGSAIQFELVESRRLGISDFRVDTYIHYDLIRDKNNNFLIVEGDQEKIADPPYWNQSYTFYNAKTKTKISQLCQKIFVEIEPSYANTAYFNKTYGDCLNLKIVSF